MLGLHRGEFSSTGVRDDGDAACEAGGKGKKRAWDGSWAA